MSRALRSDRLVMHFHDGLVDEAQGMKVAEYLLPICAGAGAKVFNDAAKYVASRTRPKLEWSNSVLLEGDAAEVIAALKREDGPELQMHGSANLIQGVGPDAGRELLSRARPTAGHHWSSTISQRRLSPSSRIAARPTAGPAHQHGRLGQPSGVLLGR